MNAVDKHVGYVRLCVEFIGRKRDKIIARSTAYVAQNNISGRSEEMKPVLILRVHNIRQIDPNVFHHHLFRISTNECESALIPEHRTLHLKRIHAVKHHTENPGMGEPYYRVVAVDLSRIVKLMSAIEIIRSPYKRYIPVFSFALRKMSVLYQRSVRIILQVKTASLVRTKQRCMRITILQRN